MNLALKALDEGKITLAEYNYYIEQEKKKKENILEHKQKNFIQSIFSKNKTNNLENLRVNLNNKEIITNNNFNNNLVTPIPATKQPVVIEKPEKEKQEASVSDALEANNTPEDIVQDQIGKQKTTTSNNNIFSRLDRTKILSLIFLLLLGGWAIFGLITSTGLTGLVTLEVPEDINIDINNNYIPITLNNSILKVEGYEYGEGELWLEQNKTKLLVYKPKEVRALVDYGYEINETINVTVIPNNATFTLWLDDGISKIPVENNFVADEGIYNLDIIINNSGNITKETFELLIGQKIPREYHFNSCEETCINLNGDWNLTAIGKIHINKLIKTEEVINNPPVQIIELPNIEFEKNYTINLSDYFVDPEGFKLNYDINNIVGVNEEIIDEVLYLSGSIPGTYDATIYISDLENVIQDEFLITVLEVIEENITETNSSNLIINVNNTIEINDSLNTTDINETINETVLETNITTIDCSEPDPNLRPVECLQENSRTYFQDQTILITNTERVAVARITPIGNLLIKGRPYTNAVFHPKKGDYQISYENQYGESITTIWFETSTGDLYTSGDIIEENANLEPKPGSFVLKNKKGIVLAWADQKKGDLYVRGNLIPFKEI